MNSFDYFLEITKIPRPSHKEGKIAEFLMDFAKVHNLSYKTDKFNNVIIFKDNGSNKTVALQAHTDMVCEKDFEVDFDFDNDSIKTIINGDFISAQGTTLGADDGFGIALILYALENFDNGYPNIEAVFTTAEEVDMSGAINIDCSTLKASNMIGLDSTNSEEIVVSCAKGIDFLFSKEITREKTEEKGYKISISGLLGGHSGDDIHLNRGNANKILFDFMHSLNDARISCFKGGNKLNAIPREAECTFTSNKNDIFDRFNNYKELLKNQFPSETDLKIDLTTNKVDDVIDYHSNFCIFNMISEFKNGVLYENEYKMPIASINLSKVDICDKIDVQTMFRTNEIGLKEKYLFEYHSLAQRHNIEFTTAGETEMFQRTAGNLVQVCIDTYQKLFNSQPKIIDIHAGLEGGVFAKKIKNIDIVNLGADLYDIHSPKERMKISSLNKLEKWLSAILKNI